MLCQFTWKHQTDSSLDFSAGKCCLLVVRCELSGFSGDSVEDIVDEGVHDGHTPLGDTCIGMDLLEDLVNVGGVTLGTLLGFSLAGCGLLRCLGGLLGRSLSHFVCLLK